MKCYVITAGSQEDRLDPDTPDTLAHPTTEGAHTALTAL